MVEDFTKKLKLVTETIQVIKTEVHNIKKLSSQKDLSGNKQSNQHEIAPATHTTNESTIKDKLKSLDTLIIKVGNLVDKREQDDKSVQELVNKMSIFEEQLESKADKVKMCKLIDRKAEIDDINRALIEIHDELDKNGSKGARQGSRVGDTALVSTG